MTISPITSMSVPTAAAGEAPTSGVDAEFAALVELSLGGAASVGAPLGGVPNENQGEFAETQEDSAGDSPEETDTSEAGEGAIVLMSALAGALAVIEPQPAQSTQIAGTTDSTSAPLVEEVPSGAARSGSSVADVALAKAAASPGTDLHSPQAQQSAHAPDQDLSTPHAVATSGSGAMPPTDGTAGSSPAPFDALAHRPSGIESASPNASIDISGFTPVAAATPLSAPTTVAPVMSAGNQTAPASATPVTDQVFGDVTRMVTRGDGTHRITIKLQPEALGDVRVTLTVKDGAVSVSLAADARAQQALISGAHELHRLLESVGATSSDIVVKDLPSSIPSRTDHGQTSAQQQWSDSRGQSPDQSAGKQSGETSARDGGTMEARRPAPIDPATRTRSAGVDVTM